MYKTMGSTTVSIIVDILKTSGTFLAIFPHLLAFYVIHRRTGGKTESTITEHFIVVIIFGVELWHYVIKHYFT